MSENTETAEETVEESAEETALTLTEDENNMLIALRQRATQLSNEIGAMEIRKARLIGAVSSTEAQANQLLQDVADRLEIPKGQSWQVTPEGVVTLTEQE
tara:strand:- start:22 stop:321 length:300 start_codon:yes stop_codon:yes gene_type:complete